MSRLVAGRYRLDQRLSETGAYLDVWAAQDEVLGRMVTVKLIDAGSRLTPEARQQLLAQAGQAASLVHPNIASTYDSGSDDGVGYVVSEYAVQGNLAQKLDGGSIGSAEALKVLAGAAAGIAHAHSRGVIHGGLSPAAVTLTSAGGAKVADFGTGDPPARYLPREQTKSTASDVFGLGAIVSALSESARLELPADLIALVEKARSTEPAERPEAAELALALQSAAGHGAHESKPLPKQSAVKTYVSRPARPTSKGRGAEASWVLGSLAVVALAVGVVSLVIWLTSNSGLDLGGANAAPLEITGGGTFDPDGDEPTENNDRFPLAFDSAPETAWATLNYTTADFGKLKSGVGIYFDLATPHSVEVVEVTSVSGGWEGAIRRSEDAATWTSPGPLELTEVSHRFETSGEARYWMVWIAKLVLTEGQGREDIPFSVGISEVAILGQ